MQRTSREGYTPAVELDERDDIFVSRVWGVRDIISFDADSTLTSETKCSSVRCTSDARQ
jgi:hypothetical protein